VAACGPFTNGSDPNDAPKRSASSHVSDFLKSSFTYFGYEKGETHKDKRT
jgi:hypothetical protein